MASRVKPADGQESVWDYPRPPKLEACPENRIRIVVDGVTIVDTDQSVRVLATSHPPVYYIPLAALDEARMIVSERHSWCEWKGEACYFSLVVNSPGKPESVVVDAGWFYPNPDRRYADLHRKFAIYASKVDACFVDQHRVTAQEGDFYGGWITPLVVGPFKGAPHTRGW